MLCNIFTSYNISQGFLGSFCSFFFNSQKNTVDVYKSTHVSWIFILAVSHLHKTRPKYSLTKENFICLSEFVVTVVGRSPVLNRVWAFVFPTLEKRLQHMKIRWGTGKNLEIQFPLLIYLWISAFFISTLFNSELFKLHIFFYHSIKLSVS